MAHCEKLAGHTGNPNPCQDTTPIDPINADQVNPNQDSVAKDRNSEILGEGQLPESSGAQLGVAKAFYFFYFAAFGSLFSLLGLYFKTLGLNGAQTGVLSGCRPVVEYFAAPLWVACAERINRPKIVLIASLCCWILFTFPLGSIQPESVACIYRINQSHYYISDPEPVDYRFNKREAPPEEYYSGLSENENGNDKSEEYVYLPPTLNLDSPPSSSSEEEEYLHVRSKRYIPQHPPGISPLEVNYAVHYDKQKHNDWISPSLTSHIFKKDNVQKVFFLLLLLVVMGEALSCCSIVLVDTAVLSFLRNQAANKYAYQRIFGNVGWGISMLFIGILVDSGSFHEWICAPSIRERNYDVCFSIFIVLMALAILFAWGMKMPEQVQGEAGGSAYQQTVRGFFKNILVCLFLCILNCYFWGRGLYISKGGIPYTTVFAQQQNGKLVECVKVLKHFKKSPSCMAFLGIAWLMGVGVGLISTFLFWHLQDIASTRTQYCVLFGVASVINQTSKVFAYLFSSQFISRFGHVTVLCVGLLCSFARFLYISLLSNPWWVLPFEVVHGITHVACWAACSSYLVHNTPTELYQQTQSVVYGLHYGLGRGLGAIVGGICVANFGTTDTFRFYSLLCFISLGAFGILNCCKKDTGGVINNPLSREDDTHQI